MCPRYENTHVVLVRDKFSRVSDIKNIVNKNNEWLCSKNASLRHAGIDAFFFLRGIVRDMVNELVDALFMFWSRLLQTTNSIMFEMF